MAGELDLPQRGNSTSPWWPCSSTARPLKRAIQEHLLDPLATKLLAGEFKPGDKIKVGVNGDELTFKLK